MLCYNCMNEKGDAVVCPRCQAEQPVPLPHHLPPGSVIGGRYVIGKALGEGGFGITYIGLDKRLNCPVSVKEYYFHGYSQRNTNTREVFSISAGDGDDVYEKGKTRFLNEAQNLARFRNEPGIVNAVDFFEENNTAYIVMEYLEGKTLREYLETHGVMTPDEAIGMLTPVMRALEVIHKAGMIHRDVSPDNIMVLSGGSVKLMDFGAAREVVDGGRSLSVLLKPGYAPEEQYRRRGEQGSWTDVYVMCATLYRCITGVVPEESLERLDEDNLKKPSELGITISPAVEDALMYGLAVKKKDRCPDMTELMRRLSGGTGTQTVSKKEEKNTKEKENKEEKKENKTKPESKEADTSKKAGKGSKRFSAAFIMFSLPLFGLMVYLIRIIDLWLREGSEGARFLAILLAVCILIGVITYSLSRRRSGSIKAFNFIIIDLIILNILLSALKVTLEILGCKVFAAEILVPILLSMVIGVALARYKTASEQGSGISDPSKRIAVTISYHCMTVLAFLYYTVAVHVHGYSRIVLGGYFHLPQLLETVLVLGVGIAVSLLVKRIPKLKDFCYAVLLLLLTVLIFLTLNWYDYTIEIFDYYTIEGIRGCMVAIQIVAGTAAAIFEGVILGSIMRKDNH